jgi:uncharacterized protein YndB with AHSA1/START domain
MITKSLPHRLDRTIVIQASPDTVFRFFTDTGRWARWWGAGSTVDPRPGGRVFIRFPDGTEVVGEIVELTAPEQLVFTYGFASGTPILPGSSRVAIRLEKHGPATRLHLSHEFDDAAVRDEHVQGWRYQLALFSNVVSDEVNAGAGSLVDRWFDAWAEPNPDARAAVLAAIADPDVRFRDRYSLTESAADLMPHIAAAQRFMPGIRLTRRGDVRHCQGVVLADWAAVTGDGQERGSGTNVFVLGADGRITSVTGFWAPPKSSSRP